MLDWSGSRISEVAQDLLDKQDKSGIIVSISATPLTLRSGNRHEAPGQPPCRAFSFRRNVNNAGIISLSADAEIGQLESARAVEDQALSWHFVDRNATNR